MKPYESRKLEDLHIVLQAAYLAAERKFNNDFPEVNVIRTCTYRNNAMQQVYFNKRPKITNARPGESPHNYNPSFAFDIAFVRNRKLDWSPKYFKAFAEIIKGISSDIVWGGDWVRFKDAPHFELKNWRAKL
jgi:peptidoglycan L-alanyl-D-glutamate endopeptidase CwlK